MESRTRLFGHSIHHSIVALPVGLFVAAVVFDAAALAADAPTLFVVAYWCLLVGVLAALAAVPFGVMDLWRVPRKTRAARIGLLHAVFNFVGLVLFGGSWALRHLNGGQPDTLALVLSFTAGGLSLTAAWLGGELVSRLGIAVFDGANVNAPSSLDRRAHHDPPAGPAD